MNAKEKLLQELQDKIRKIGRGKVTKSGIPACTITRILNNIPVRWETLDKYNNHLDKYFRTEKMGK